MKNFDIYYKANTLHFEHIGWKYYSKLKKKAMEQEFSISGLVISLSIAFFIVISSALALSFLYSTIEGGQLSKKKQEKKIYFLESSINFSLDAYHVKC